MVGKVNCHLKYNESLTTVGMWIIPETKDGLSNLGYSTLT